MKTLGALTISLLSLMAFAGSPQQSGGWKPLFDGKTLTGWRGYKQQQVPDGWKVQDGVIVRQSGGGDLVTNDEFGDFELALEWKISEGGNSGVFYRAIDDQKEIWHMAPEYQILDNAKHSDGKNPLTSAGACYALYAPDHDMTKPVGQWNETRIIAKGKHVEHWMNGMKLLEFEIGSPDWNKRVAESKFKVYPHFGEQPRGRIGLQDHGNEVWYRNIRIRELK
jgi:hypothetical protein